MCTVWGRSLSKRRGFVLVAFTLGLLLILGCVGLAYDIGRMYIVKNESQTFCDSAALSAAWMLDGSTEGISNARSAALATTKRYNLGNTTFGPNNITVEFAQDPPAGWAANPANPAGYVMVRVTTSADLPMMIMPVVTGRFNATIGATAIAKQVPLPGGAPNSIFPFAPLVIPPGAGTVPSASQQPDDPFGMVPAQYTEDGRTVYQHGGVYTLRGPARINDPIEDMCPNDATTLGAAYRLESGQPDRGYIWNSNSAKDINDAILGNVTPPDGSIDIGDNITDACDYCKVNGVKESEVKAMRDRVASDTDSTTRWYADYIAAINAGSGTYGNYQRVVTVPIATGACGTSVDINGTPVSVPCPSGYGPNTVTGFAAFFLLPYEKSNKGPYGLPGAYYGSGGAPICAEYIGPWNGGGGASAGGGVSNRIAKLVQ